MKPQRKKDTPSGRASIRNVHLIRNTFVFPIQITSLIENYPEIRINSCENII